MKVAEFIGMLFEARGIAHSAHLNTRSFAEHKALEEFYDSIIGVADAFAEAYQGSEGLIGDIPITSAKQPATMVRYLNMQVAAIQAARYDFVDESCTTLQNLIDEILAIYMSAIYKLRFLS